MIRILLAMAMIASPVLADVAAKPTVNPSEPADKMVCQEDATTGTRFAKRVCHTRRDWAAMSEAARRNAHDSFDGPRTTITTEH